MFRMLYLLAMCFSVLKHLNAQQYGSFKDPLEGKVYKTVKIGSQIWMAENLNVSRFRNGDIIPEAKTEEEWEAAIINKQPAWCYYDNDSSNSLKFNLGKLYNTYAVSDKRGLAPLGWKIPNIADWSNLIKFAGGFKSAHFKLKSKNSWIYESGITNSLGFTALPSGHRSGIFISPFDGFWWISSDSEFSSSSVNCLYFTSSINYSILISNFGNSVGLSIRCIAEKNSFKDLNIIPEQMNMMAKKNRFFDIYFNEDDFKNPFRLGNLEVMRKDFDIEMYFPEAKGISKIIGNGWRLPTISELKVLYKNRFNIGNFSMNPREENVIYLSSNEIKPEDGFYKQVQILSFDNGEVSWAYWCCRGPKEKVRLVRTINKY